MIVPAETACADGQIRSLLARIAHLADAGDLEEYLDQFTFDATWQMPANPAAGAPADTRRGRADIGEGVRSRRAAGVQGPGTATRHVITTVAVEFVSEASATSTAYWMFFADTAGTARLVGVGRYDDELRREDGRWHLASRRITVG